MNNERSVHPKAAGHGTFSQVTSGSLDENDPGERRERMRRYLASLNLGNPSDHTKLMGVYSDLVQNIARRMSGHGFDADAYRDRWVQTLKVAGFELNRGATSSQILRVRQRSA
ncbi:MAG: hypothetical protein QOI06_1809 [Nocardioidaceae bacterium]|jgi:hypothetical protein|nr:hypothetical protein [Nocardioidaceae bacterium]